MTLTIPSKTIYLDHETTGGHPPRDMIYEIAMIDDEGRVIIDTLVNPERPLPSGARYRGFTDEDFFGKPTLRELWSTIEAIITGVHVVCYNAEADSRFYPKRLAAAGHVSCAMRRFAPVYGDYSAYHNDYSFKSLKVAADYIGYRPDGPPHRALTDAFTCRAVWRWLEDRDDFNAAPQPPARTAALTDEIIRMDAGKHLG